MKTKTAITKIGEIINSINKFGEENKMNWKILFGVLVLIFAFVLSKSFIYGLIGLLIAILISIESINKWIFNYLDLIEPSLYFLIYRYIPNFISLQLKAKVIYYGFYKVLMIVLAGILMINFNSLLLSFYQGELQKEIGEKLMVWVIVSFLFLILGNLIKLFRLLFKLTLNWIFLISCIAISVILDIENSIYSNIANSVMLLLVTIIVTLYFYKPLYKEYIDKYDYFRLWYNESKNDWKKYIILLEGQSKKELNNISIISDNPIKYKDDDLFGYKYIADNTYNLIKGINVDNGSYSIGIIGEWGLGKSSIIGMLKESKLKLDSNIIIHEFNPWNYAKSDLINSFITEIASKINKKGLTKLLIKYIELLGGINSTAGAIIKLIESLFGTDKTIDEVRKQIGEELGKINKKLIVIIDDLDRCEPDEIITMLNVVKNIGNFSHVIYLVSFDKIHIIEALKSKGFHKDYIEKIINTEIHVPLPDKESKSKYFVEQFSSILSDINITEDTISKSCKLITEIGASGMDEIFDIRNLRFIKKLLNKLNVNMKLAFNTKKSGITELKADNISKIVLINYIKIKDLELFNDSIQKRLSIQCGEPFKRSSPNMPALYTGLKLKKLETMFLREIIGLSISFSGDNENILYISNISNQDNLSDTIRRNYELLKEFS